MLIYTNLPVNVLVQLLGHVVAVNQNMFRNANGFHNELYTSHLLDNMHHVGDIEASSSDSCCHQNRHPACLEVFQSLEKSQQLSIEEMKKYNEHLLSFALKSVSVDARCWETLTV